MIAGGAARDLVDNRAVMLTELGFAAFSVAETGTWLAILVYAFDRGGVGEAGIVAFALLVPAALIVPFAAVVVDRLPTNRALAGGFGSQAAGCGLTAIAMATSAPPILVYLAAAGFAVAISLSRPTVSAVLPALVDRPVELVAANALAGFIETVGAFAGPALAGLVLLVASPTAVFASGTGLLTVAAVLAIGVGPAPLQLQDAVDRAAVGTAPDRDLEHDEPEPHLSAILAGLRLIRDQPAPRLLVAMLAAAWLVFGALDVALVAVAVDQLGRSEATAGLLGSAIGVGGVVGALASFALVGRRRLTVPVVVGLLAVGVPIALIPGTRSLALVVALLVLTGLGDAISDIAGRTLLQGLAAEDTLARVFGVLEGLATAAFALGSIGFSAVAVVAGLPTAMIVVGAVLPAFLLVRFGRLLAIDRTRPAVDGELLALVRAMPIFAPLPAFRVEQLLVNLQRVEIQPGRLVFARGDRGREFYLVAGGSALVELDEREVETGVGGGFGEIALLYDRPRTATVRAGPDGLLAYSLDGAVFLDAISSAPRSRARAVRAADRRLGEQ